MSPLQRFALSFLALFAASFAAHAAEGPDILAGLKTDHPYLILTADDWKNLNQRKQSDPDVGRLLAKIEAQARMELDESPVIYKKDGKRLLAVSREALRRVIMWSAAYRLTGEAAFAQRAEKEMLDVAAFNDWNTSHFLDTAEMTAACAFGYDWVYERLSPASRDIIRRAILEKGLVPGTGPNSWQQNENNWNQVCFGGLTLGALAIAHEEPQAARRLLELARRDNPNGMKPYAPDGIYPEGPGYWEYGTTYEVMMISALESALGTDWGITKSPGFMASSRTQLELRDAAGIPFNFSDSEASAGLEPACFWFARRLHQPDLLWFQQKYLEKMLDAPKLPQNAYLPLLASWMEPHTTPIPPPDLPLTWHGGGINPVGVFRSSSADANAVFLAFKGGSAGNSHGHMDAGSFVLSADGVRWACDLGRQDYLSLESKGVDLWNMAQDAGRWTVFRLNNSSHNTLTIDGQLHRVAGHAQITEFGRDSQANATVDLSPVFAGQADRVVRNFALAGRTVTVRDELTGVGLGKDVRWAMVTKAEVDLNGGTATLRQDGKTLSAKILSPAAAKFSVIPADPPQDNYDAPNPDTRILVIHVTAPEDGKINLGVELKPGAE